MPKAASSYNIYKHEDGLGNMKLSAVTNAVIQKHLQKKHEVTIIRTVSAKRL